MNNHKKVALVTCYFQHNYGSQLQAFATEMMCRKIGVDFETIRIDGLRGEINRAKYCYFLSKLYDIDTIKDKSATVRKLWARKTNSEYRKNLETRDALFDKFAKDQFHLSRAYCSKKELSEYAADYYAFIVGSDQLWLPSNIESDYYTLSFVPDNVKKIAYATSFGVSKLPNRQAEAARRFLPRFDSIFVREQSGQDLVKDLDGREAPIVCDPTMMFTAQEWNELIPQDRRVKEPYILCYFLGNNPWQRNWAKKLAKEKECMIVQLPNLDNYIASDRCLADYALYDVDPFGFVALIRDAEYVLTDSFHCTVFSNLFEKEFFVFRRYYNDGTVSTNSRVYSLLDRLGEPNRMVSYGMEPNTMDTIQRLYTEIQEQIVSSRNRSYSLFSESLFKLNDC